MHHTQLSTTSSLQQPSLPEPAIAGASSGAFGASVGRPRAGGWRGVRFSLFPEQSKVPRDFRLSRRDANRPLPRGRTPGRGG
eukprot:gene15275-biopygen17172